MYRSSVILGVFLDEKSGFDIILEYDNDELLK